MMCEVSKVLNNAQVLLILLNRNYFFLHCQLIAVVQELRITSKKTCEYICALKISWGK